MRQLIGRKVPKETMIRGKDRRMTLKKSKRKEIEGTHIQGAVDRLSQDLHPRQSRKPPPSEGGTRRGHMSRGSKKKVGENEIRSGHSEGEK